jgi:type IV secretion system protein VirB9
MTAFGLIDVFPRWRVFAPLLALCVAHAAGAETLPARSTGDSRLRVAAYRADEVYRLHGFVGYQIDLEFESGETYAGTGGGDLEGITLGAFDNHLILKPKAAHVGTNLLIFTNRRHYHIEYTASARRPNVLIDEVMYAVRFTYPPRTDPKTTGPSLAEQVETQLVQSSAARPRNIDYWYCGHPAVRPIAASDDGVHTRLTFGAKAELPAIFVRNDDDSESLLNFSMEAGDVVVHRVAPRFIVRRGKITGCVVNKGFVGVGERLDSGTVAPDIKRERKETRP